MTKKKQILNQIHTASCPHEPYVLVENILSEIYIKQSLKTLDISENFNIPKPAAVVIRNELLSNGLIEQVNRKIHLSPRGIEYVRNTLGYGLICLDKYQQFIHEHSEIVEFSPSSPHACPKSPSDRTLGLESYGTFYEMTAVKSVELA